LDTCDLRVEGIRRHKFFSYVVNFIQGGLPGIPGQALLAGAGFVDLFPQPMARAIALDLGGFQNLRGLVGLVRRYLVQKTSEVLKTSEVWQAV